MPDLPNRVSLFVRCRICHKTLGPFNCGEKRNPASFLVADIPVASPYPLAQAATATVAAWVLLGLDAPLRLHPPPVHDGNMHSKIESTTPRRCTTISLQIGHAPKPCTGTLYPPTNRPLVSNTRSLAALLPKQFCPGEQHRHNIPVQQKWNSWELN